MFTKDLKLLIVEDEESLSKLLKDSLNDYFHTVITASDGFEALEKFKKIKIDIVITDIMMPKMDGLELSTKLKEQNENLPIIVLSAYSHKEMLLKAIDISIDKYFIKPYDLDEVIEYLQELANKLNKKKIIKLIDNFFYENSTNRLFKGKEIVKLTKREKNFIILLLENLSIPVAAEVIKDTLWEKEEEISDERLRTFIKRLRLKTSKDLIKNHSGQGYLISPDNL